MKLSCIFAAAIALCSQMAWAQTETDLKVDDAVVSATLMGEGDHAVIALHGNGGNRGYFFSDKGSKFGQSLAEAGFKVIAVTWSGQAGGGMGELKTALQYARNSGAKKISVMGFSRGGEAAAVFTRNQPDGTFNTLVQLSSVDDQGVALTATKKLFAYNKNDKWGRWQGAAFDKSAEPKTVVALGGSGHQVADLVSEKADLINDVIGALKQ